jgi:hypothetical protein
MTELSSNVRVFLRLRPLNKFEISRRNRKAVDVISETNVHVDTVPEMEFECDGVSLSRVRHKVI